MKKSFFAFSAAGLVAILILGTYKLLNHSRPAVAAPAASLNNTAPSNLTVDVVPAHDPNRAQDSARAAPLTERTKPTQPDLGTQPKSSELVAAAKPFPAKPPLTREFDRPEILQIDDRKWAVLGTRDVLQGNGYLTVLVLRDESSGQLEFRQSALRFVLEPGADYEAFIRGRRNTQRIFVNSLYADVAVASANIAAEYTAFAADTQVLKVQFIPLVVPVKPR